MNTLINTDTQLNENYLEELSLLQKVVDNLEDGVLISTETGELIHANSSADNICSQIKPDSFKLKGDFKFVRGNFQIVQQASHNIIFSILFSFSGFNLWVEIFPLGIS